MPRAYVGPSASEREIENLARTVACPNCGAEPPNSCNSLEANRSQFPIPFAHTGRLLVARGET